MSRKTNEGATIKSGAGCDPPPILACQVVSKKSKKRTNFTYVRKTVEDPEVTTFGQTCLARSGGPII